MMTEERSEKSGIVDFESGESGPVRQGMWEALSSWEETRT